MAKTDRERAPIIMRRKGNHLEPASQFDAEMVAELAFDRDIEVSIKQRRSLPQMRAYWAMLANVVEATECYPTAERLHEAIKIDCGYCTQFKTLRGAPVLQADSIAFSRMDGVEFSGFFKRAERLIAETYGIDPKELGKAAA